MPHAPEPVLRLSLDEDPIATISSSDLPAERGFSLQLRSNQPVLRFEDSAGHQYRFDLESVRKEHFDWLHLNARVHQTFAVQSDCLLSNQPHFDRNALRPGSDWHGIRFQPFYLPQCPGDPQSLRGRGLFFRGLHFPGTITPGNVSLMCICDECRRSFRIQSFHAGFSNLAYFYCDQGPHTLVTSSYEDDAPPVLGKADPATLPLFESKLPACRKCGGSFRYLNPFRCPHCLAPYIDFTRHPHDRESEYYGNHLFGDTLQHRSP